MSHGAYDSDLRQLCGSGSKTCSGPSAHEACGDEHFCMASGFAKGCCKPCHDCLHHEDAYPGTSCTGSSAANLNNSWVGQDWCHGIQPQCPEACQHRRFDSNKVELRL